jgi:hypothetical protein
LGLLVVRQRTGIYREFGKNGNSLNIEKRWEYNVKLNLTRKIVAQMGDEWIGLEINVEKTKYMLLSRHQNVGQNRDIKKANRSFENVSQFKYLGMTVTNQNLIQEEIKRRLNSGNACHHSVQNLLSSRLLSKKLKNFKIRIYRVTTHPSCTQYIDV